MFDTINDGFQQQPRRGFLNPDNRQDGGRDRGRNRDGGQHDGDGHLNGQRKASNSNWKQKLPQVTGQSREAGFAAPVDLFVFNVNKEVSEEGIVTFMYLTMQLGCV